MLKLQRTTSNNLYANFLTLENKEATTVVDPKITIRHVDSGGATVVDLNEQPMSLAIETLYYFKWTIPEDADLGVYSCEYEAIVDGEYAEANEMFEIGEFEGDEQCDVYYTTKAKVATYLGVEEDDIQDDWILWATRYIEFYTRQVFCPATTIEKHDIDKLQESTVMLDNYPLLEVLEVKNDGAVMDLANILTYEDEGFIKIKDYYSTSSILETGFFVRGRQTVEVTYKYGYTSTPKQVEWAATVFAATIAIPSLTQSGTLSVGDIVEEEIGEYRRKRSVEESGATSFSTSIEGSKNINDRLEEDVFSAKTILRHYRGNEMRSV